MSNQRLVLTVFMSLLFLSGCTTIQKPDESWDAFFSMIPGKEAEGSSPEKAERRRLFPFSIERGSPQASQVAQDFSTTCKHVGGSIATSQSSGQAREFLKALSEWWNGEALSYGTLSEGWSIVCENPQAGTVIAAVIFYQNRGSRYFQYSQKAWQSPTVAFYRTGNVSEFIDYYISEEKRRMEKMAESVKHGIGKRTRQLRTFPKVGDETTHGVIIKLRASRALIQYHEVAREILSLPPYEWVPINSLVAPLY